MNRKLHALDHIAYAHLDKMAVTLAAARQGMLTLGTSASVPPAKSSGLVRFFFRV